jgi:transposase-like protein
MRVRTDVKTCGVQCTVFPVRDGGRKLLLVVGNVWPLATAESYSIHPIRNMLKVASATNWTRSNTK